jgi:hypothetical protein
VIAKACSSVSICSYASCMARKPNASIPTSPGYFPRWPQLPPTLTRQPMPPRRTQPTTRLRRKNPRPRDTAASRCPRICRVRAPSTRLPKRNAFARAAAWSARSSARTSASNSISSPPACSCASMSASSTHVRSVMTMSRSAMCRSPSSTRDCPVPDCWRRSPPANMPIICRCTGSNASSRVTASRCRVRRCATGWPVSPKC